MNRRTFLALAGQGLVGMGLVAAGCVDQEVLGGVLDAAGVDPQTKQIVQSSVRVGGAAFEASKDITEEQEIYLGRSVSARLLTKYKLLNNAKLHRYVHMVGSTVAMESDRPDLPYHFGVLNTQQVNAFAGPGGYIFITYGIIRRLKSEDELAAILAHEIGHCSARHGMEMIKSSQWKGVAAILAQEGARTAGASEQLVKEFGNITDSILDTFLTAGYEQPMEFEADSLGQAYATRAKYNPQSLRNYLQLMADREKKGDGGLKARLGTHPSFTARLAQLPPAQGKLNKAAWNVRRRRFLAAIK